MHKAFTRLRILDPQVWLKDRKKENKPCEEFMWGELFKEIGEERTLAAPTKTAIMGYGIKANVAGVCVRGSLTYTILTMLPPDISLYFCEEEVVMVISNLMMPMHGFQFGVTTDSQIFDASKLGIAPWYALLLAWEKNPQREYARRARVYICDTILEVLEEEKQTTK